MLAVNHQYTRRQALQLGAGAAAALLLPHTLSAAEDSTAKKPPLRLLTRADDLGCARSLNRAVRQCVTEGIVKNVSVLAPTPYIAEAAADLAGLDHVCFGLHTALNSEWTNLRWGPVAPRDKVRTLLQEDGTLHQYLGGLERVDADEALIELTAQLEKARSLGFDIRYADSHMGAIGRVPGLADKFAAWCRENDLIDHRTIETKSFTTLPNYWARPDHRKDADFPRLLLDAMKNAPRDGLYQIVGHPAFDDEETQKLGHNGYPGAAVANNLNLERLGFTSPDIVAYCKSDAVQLVRYDEAAQALG